jgi:phospholipid/cholesterol/gamma-HCH transport system substrate-binding protein
MSTSTGSARRARGTATLLTLVMGTATLSACGFDGASSLPLPGGQGNGDGAYQVTIEFTDVIDLVPQSAVKVNDVAVGSVKSLEVTGYTARVVVALNEDIVLPSNSRASVRQTSLLGEKFVSFEPPPASEATGRLRGGEIIGLDRTTRSAEIEEVLGALSLVLNGGSLEQLQVINKELIAALEGREDRVKSLLDELNVFVGSLDEQKLKIVRALDSLDRLSARLVNDRQIIATALEDIPPGLAVLTGQREEITQLLTSLDTLGDVATRVISATQANTVADLRALEPILTQLNEAGRALPESLELLTTYPFPRTVTEGIKGDYANLFVTLDLDLRGGGAPALPTAPVTDPAAEAAAAAAAELRRLQDEARNRTLQLAEQLRLDELQKAALARIEAERRRLESLGLDPATAVDPLAPPVPPPPPPPIPGATVPGPGPLPPVPGIVPGLTGSSANLLRLLIGGLR